MLSDGTDLYDNPELYDLEHANYRGDFPFYRHVAELAQPRTILEFGCGTGRIALEMAAAGCAVTGIDVVPFMLTALERRLATAPPSVAERVRGARADICSYRNPHSRFGAVIAPFNLLQHLDAAALAGALRTAHTQLVADGLFACDLFAPLADDAILHDRDFTGLERRSLPREAGEMLVDRRDNFDRRNGVLTTKIRYRTLRPDGGMASCEIRTVCRRQWKLEQLRQAFAAAELKVAECYGDVELTPYHAAAPRILLIGRKLNTAVSGDSKVSN